MYAGPDAFLLVGVSMLLIPPFLHLLPERNHRQSAEFIITTPVLFVNFILAIAAIQDMNRAFWYLSGARLVIASGKTYNKYRITSFIMRGGILHD